VHAVQSQATAALARYGSYAPRGGYCHESSLRVLLHALDTAAARQGRHIEPMLSVSIDHYVRVFVRVWKGRPRSALQSGRAALVLQSSACPNFQLVPFGAATAATDSISSADTDAASTAGATAGGSAVAEWPSLCTETGAAMQVAGPVWALPTNNADWLQRVIAALEALQLTTDAATAAAAVESAEYSKLDNASPQQLRLGTAHRLLPLLRAVQSELPDVPLFVRLKDLSRALGLSKSPRWGTVAAALQSAGYTVSAHHREPTAIKSDAPLSAVFDVMRCWAAAHPPPVAKRGQFGAAAAAILAQQPQLVVDFTGEQQQQQQPLADTPPVEIQRPVYGHLRVREGLGPMPKAARQ
jgi:tRNA (guanine26-N2/guanine27-N2)-dimethyltransferase